MKIKYKILTFLLICLLLGSHPVTAQDSEVEIIPDSLTVTGDVVDNFVNMTYAFEFAGLSEDSRFRTIFSIPEGLFLSNITIETDSETFYGQVKEINEAQQDYDDAILQNKSAVLVQAIGDDYLLEANIQSSSNLYIGLNVEGYLLRYRSTYTVEFLTFEDISSIDLILDLNLVSTRTDFRSFLFQGLSGVVFTDIDNGKHISYQNSNGFLDTSVKLQYQFLSSAYSTLIGYDNGDEQFFIYQLAPEIYAYEDQTPKDYVFIIDKSGSMGGTRIEGAKSSFASIIENLNEQDFFNVITFDSEINALWETSRESNSSNIDEALSFVDGLEAAGGTNFHDALREGLQSLDNGISAAKAVTILSDGDPSTGVTDFDTIREMANTENNVDAPIFAISLGGDIDTSLMEGIAYDSNANHVNIDDNSDIQTNLVDFYQDFSAPITRGMTINFTNSYDVYPAYEDLHVPIYNGSEVLIAGKFDGSTTSTTTLEYLSFNDTYQNSIDSSNISTSQDHIEHIWAIYAINNLVERDRFEDDTTLRTQIIDLAIKYGLVIDGYTAMIVVVVEEDDIREPAEDFGGTPVDGDRPPVENVHDTQGSEVRFEWLMSVMLLIPILSASRLKMKIKI